MLNPRLLRSTFLVLALLFPTVAFTVLGQAPAGGGDKAPGPAPGVQVSIEELPGRSSEVRSQLEKLRDEMADSNRIVLLNRGVAALQFDLLEDEASLDQIELEALSLSRLNAFRTVWEDHEQRASLLADELDTQWQEWVEERENLQKEEAYWQAALAVADVDKEVRTSLDEGILRVISGIEEVDLELQLEIEKLLEVSQPLGELESRIEVAVERFREVEIHAFGLMARRDQPPLWLISREGDLTEGLFPLLREMISGELADVLEYLWSSQNRVALHGFVFAFFLASFFWLRRRSRAWEDKDEILRYSQFVLSRPLAAACIMGLLATPTVYPDAPRSVIGLATLLSVAPTTYLLPNLLGKVLQPGAYAFLLLFAFQIARDLAFANQGLRRFALLAVALMGLGIAVWALPRIKQSEAWTSRLTTFLVSLVTVAFGLSLAIATLANTLGWSRLAEYLTQASFISAYNALIILLGFIILSGLIRAFPDTPTGKFLHTISRHREKVTSRAIHLVGFACVFFWVRSLIRRFHLERLTGNRIEELLESDFALGALEISVGRILSALTVLLVAYLISRLLRFVLAEEILSRLDLRIGVIQAIATMVYYVILSLGLVAAASALGLGTENLALMASALGIGIGFGLQNVVGNFVSGLILIFERPVKVGDLVEVGSILGYVGHIGIRSSTIRTFEGAEVVVPNSELVSKQVINWTLSDLQRRRDFEVVVSWGTDPDRVIEILRDTVQSNQRVLPEPGPVVYFRGYEGGDLRFSLFFWTSIEGSLGTLSDVGLEVNRALVKAGIEVALPNRDVRIRGSIDTGPQLSISSERAEESS